MKSNKMALAALVLVVLFAFSGALAPTKSQATTVDPDYLVFQMGTENKNYETVLPQLEAEFGAEAAGSSRYVGFGVALMTLKTPVDELRSQVTYALNSAEETGLPVLIKLDDMNFTTEYTDPSMVEWTAFPKPGESYGPLAKHYWLNWGSWMALPPTPNLESTAFRKDVESRLKEGVLPPLLDRLAKWRDQNRSYLFAGMCVGWESGIPDYRMLRNAPALPRDEQRKITMTEEERGVQLGYASLYARGWTQQKIQDMAAKTGESVEDITTELLFQVIHDYTAFLAKTVHDAGIPKKRIYTHGVAWESVSDQRLPGAWMRKSSRVPPIWVNVNDFSRPGYTVGAGQFDSETLVKLLRAAGAQDGWGGVEAYVRGVESEDAFEGYLGQLFASGARLVDIFGWTAPGSPYDPKHAPGALLAVHAWLGGKDLPHASIQAAQQQTPPPGEVPQSLQQKMHELQALVGRLQQQDVDLQPVGNLMQGFEPLLQEQKFSEAEALVDRALKVAGELASHAAPQTGPPTSLQEKMQRLQALVHQREQEGGDMQPVGNLMQGFQPLMDQQKFSEAEALVDRALNLLGDSTPAAEVSTTGRGDNALIAYGARDADSRQQIFVVRTDGTEKRRLTQEGDQNYLPAWSPDGRKLAFTSNRSGSSQIWVMAADGSNPTQLTTEADNATPTWSPDGKQLAFSSKRTGHSEIWVMNADGSDQKQLTKTDAAIANDGAAWSPDGRRIAFYSNRSGHYAIWVMDPDGGHLTQFTSAEGDRYLDSNAPAWSPDGSKIAFWRGEAHKSGNIWVMNVDGSNRRQLTDQPVGINADGPAWSPDGKKILFSSNRPGSEGIGNWIMNADGSDQRVFTTNTFVRSRPSWQPIH